MCSALQALYPLRCGRGGRSGLLYQHGVNTVEDHAQEMLVAPVVMKMKTYYYSDSLLVHSECRADAFHGVVGFS